MLVTALDQPSFGSRSELRRIPTAELPRLVDRILDGTSAEPREPVEERPPLADRSLLSILRKLLSSPSDG